MKKNSGAGSAPSAKAVEVELDNVDLRSMNGALVSLKKVRAHGDVSFRELIHCIRRRRSSSR